MNIFPCSLAFKLSVGMPRYVRSECVTMEARCSKFGYNQRYTGYICNTDPRQPIWRRLVLGKSRTQCCDEPSRTWISVGRGAGQGAKSRGRRGGAWGATQPGTAPDARSPWGSPLWHPATASCAASSIRLLSSIFACAWAAIQRSSNSGFPDSDDGGPVRTIFELR